MTTKQTIELALDMLAEELNNYFDEDIQYLPSHIVQSTQLSISMESGHPLISITCNHEYEIQANVNAVEKSELINRLIELSDELNRYKRIL